MIRPRRPRERTRPLGSHGWSRGAAPIRTVPIWCAEKTEPRLEPKCIVRTLSSNRPNAASSASADPWTGWKRTAGVAATTTSPAPAARTRRAIRSAAWRSVRSPALSSR